MCVPSPLQAADAALASRAADEAAAALLLDVASETMSHSGKNGGGGGAKSQRGNGDNKNPKSETASKKTKASDMCCFHMPAHWVASCLQWAAGEQMCHLPPGQGARRGARARG